MSSRYLLTARLMSVFVGSCIRIYFLAQQSAKVVPFSLTLTQNTSAPTKFKDSHVLRTSANKVTDAQTS